MQLLKIVVGKVAALSASPSSFVVSAEAAHLLQARPLLLILKK